MRGDGTGSFEATWIVDTGFEGQGRDEADARCTHQALADGIILRHMTSPVIEYPEAVVQHQPGLQHRQQGMREGLVSFDDVTHLSIESAVTELGR